MGQALNSLTGNVFSAQDMHGSPAVFDSGESAHAYLDSALATLPASPVSWVSLGTPIAAGVCVLGGFAWVRRCWGYWSISHPSRVDSSP